MNASYRALKKIALFLFLIVLSAFALRAQEKSSGLTFSLKLNGGLGSLLDGGGDLETFRKETVAYQIARARQPGYSTRTNWDKMSTLPALDGELLFQFGRSFGIGIGSGLISVHSRGTYGDTLKMSEPANGGTYSINASTDNSVDYHLTAVPVKLSFYGFFPLGRWSVYGRAGLGYYFGRLTNAMTSDASLSESLVSPINPDVGGEITARTEGTEESKKNALGFHGGLGLEYRMGPVVLGMECFGRFVSFSGWSGSINASVDARLRTWREGVGWLPDQYITETQTEAGTLYYAEYQYTDLNGYFGNMKISKDKPFGLGIRNSREAVINLNAIGLVFSVRFIFN